MPSAKEEEEGVGQAGGPQERPLSQQGGAVSVFSVSQVASKAASAPGGGPAPRRWPLRTQRESLLGERGDGRTGPSQALEGSWGMF